MKLLYVSIANKLLYVSIANKLLYVSIANKQCYAVIRSVAKPYHSATISYG